MKHYGNQTKTFIDDLLLFLLFIFLMRAMVVVSVEAWQEEDSKKGGIHASL